MNSDRERHTFLLLSALPMERIKRELNKAGYHIAAKEQVQKDFIFYDTQDGKLFKKGKRLLYFPGPGDLMLVRGDKELKREKYQNEKLPEATMQTGEYSVGEPVGVRQKPAGSKTRAKELSECRAAARIPINLITAIDGEGKTDIYLPHMICTVEAEHVRIESPTQSTVNIALEKWNFSHPRNGISSSNHRFMSISSSTAQRDVSFLATILRNLSKIEPVNFDPLESGLLFLQAPLPGAPVPDSLKINQEDSVFQVGCKIFSQQAYKMWANTEGTQLDLDPEFLHDLRVATRRARFALRVFRPYLNSDYTSRLRSELSWIGKLLGRVRDIDVFLEHLREQYSFAQISQGTKSVVEEYLLSKRKTHYPSLVQALESSRYEEIFIGLRSAIPESKAATSAPAHLHAPTLIGKRLRSVEKLFKKAHGVYEPSDLHALRIAFKGLRYTCEFFSDLYSDQMSIHIKSIVAFQDCLGFYQDARIALKVLEEIIALRTDWNQETCFSFGALLQVQRDVMRNQLSHFRRLASTLSHTARSIKILTGTERR